MFFELFQPFSTLKPCSLLQEMDLKRLMAKMEVDFKQKDLLLEQKVLFLFKSFLRNPMVSGLPRPEATSGKASTLIWLKYGFRASFVHWKW